ncbi:putative lipoprotein thiredoxin [Hydrogenimonas sp.]|nr:putative lipoprotein thiredoxin [Hydrogenimonas sp.]
MKKILLLLSALVAVAVSPAMAQNVTTFTLKGNGAPTLHVKETENGILFDEYRGKVVLLNFFGKHCKWCMKEIPHLVELQKKYKNSFQVVAVHAQQPLTPGERSRLEARFHFNYPIYESTDNPDFVSYIGQRAGWTGALPFSVIFDKNGSAVKIVPGYLPKESLEQIIGILTK